MPYPYSQEDLRYHRKLQQAFGGKFHAWRKTCGYTLQETAELLEMSEAYMGLVDRGKRIFAYPNLYKFHLLSGLSYDYLLSIDAAVSGDLRAGTKHTIDSLSDVAYQSVARYTSMLAILDCKKDMAAISFLDETLEGSSMAIRGMGKRKHRATGEGG